MLTTQYQFRKLFITVYINACYIQNCTELTIFSEVKFPSSFFTRLTFYILYIFYDKIFRKLN